MARMKPICTINDCGRPRHSLGYCKMHRRRLERNGSPHALKLIIGDDAARFWAKVDKTSTCWVWRGGTYPGGYGQFYKAGKHVGAHRQSYEMAKGAIPEGMQIDHTCHNRACVNPQHLQAVTHKQNGENVLVQRRSKSGVRGVSLSPGSGKWRARVGHNGVQLSAGHFDTIAEAERAVIALRNELFTNNLADRRRK